MNTLRFKAGELAILAYPTPGSPRFWQSMVVVIEEVGPFPRNHRFSDGLFCHKPCDYGIRAADGTSGYCLDAELKKIDPPADDETITRHKERTDEASA